MVFYRFTIVLAIWPTFEVCHVHIVLVELQRHVSFMVVLASKRDFSGLTSHGTLYSRELGPAEGFGNGSMHIRYRLRVVWLHLKLMTLTGLPVRAVHKIVVMFVI